MLLTGLHAMQLRRDFAQFNARLNEFTGTPVHDIHSHAADAFRGFAVRHKEPKPARVPSGRQQQPQGDRAWMV